MKLQSPAESDKNRSNSTNRRQDEGVPGIWYLFFGRRNNVRRFDDYYQKSYFLDHYSLMVFSIIT